jgi:hypothetical protein
MNRRAEECCVGIRIRAIGIVATKSAMGSFDRNASRNDPDWSAEDLRRDAAADEHRRSPRRSAMLPTSAP